MKVHIGPYRYWFGPYQLAEAICFWVRPIQDEYGFPTKPRWVHLFGEWLAHGSIRPDPEVGELRPFAGERHETWIYKLLQWIHEKKKRKVYVRIDRWDTWSMDDTLAHIILPMLKQLKASKHGYPMVDDEDVPEYLRSTAAPALSQEQIDTGYPDDNQEARWNWALDEMIFAFDSKINDGWEEQFHSGETDWHFKYLEDGNSELVHGPNHTATYDFEGRKAYQERITNGFRLFGKYYEALWD